MQHLPYSDLMVGADGSYFNYCQPSAKLFEDTQNLLLTSKPGIPFDPFTRTIVVIRLSRGD